jgi:hypothetical protein
MLANTLTADGRVVGDGISAVSGAEEPPPRGRVALAAPKGWIPEVPGASARQGRRA